MNWCLASYFIHKIDIGSALRQNLYELFMTWNFNWFFFLYPTKSRISEHLIPYLAASCSDVHPLFVAILIFAPFFIKTSATFTSPKSIFWLLSHWIFFSPTLLCLVYWSAELYRNYPIWQHRVVALFHTALNSR